MMMPTTEQDYFEQILTRVLRLERELRRIEALAGEEAFPGIESVWIPAEAMSPSTTNGCADLATIEIQAGRPEIRVLAFDKDSDEHAQFSLPLPPRWDNGTITFRVFWTNASATTNGVAWALQAVAKGDGNPIDAAYGTAVVVTDDSLNETYGENISAESAALTIAGAPAANEMIDLDIYRDVSDGNDDLAEDALLRGVWVYYTADYPNDSVEITV